MGACRKKPAQPASGTLSWMTPSETLLRLCLGGFGDMKWAWGGGWRLPVCQTTSSPGFCPISRAHFRDRKTLRKRVHHKGPPLNMSCVSDLSGPCPGCATHAPWRTASGYATASEAAYPRLLCERILACVDVHAAAKDVILQPGAITLLASTNATAWAQVCSPHFRICIYSVCSCVFRAASW